MDFTRREFLGLTAGVVGMVGVPQGHTAGEPRPEPFEKWWTMYSDPKNYDSESAQGYRSALSPGRWWGRSVGDPNPFARLSFLVAPYVVSLYDGFSRCLSQALYSGTTVLLESGAGFVDDSTFWHHSRWLRQELGIHVAPRVDLWAKWAEGNDASAPYIEFSWPRHAKIRDFSRVVPPAEESRENIIAWAGDLPVAFRRRVGKGLLIYLGSPVGPALWAGDPEARRWLDAIADTV